MNNIKKVYRQPTGASFYRADLHIHTFGGSHDVGDSTMTPAAIVQTAQNEGIRIIAITDHNEITNVGAAIEAAERSKVFVVPGIELSTPQGHLLCYLPDLRALQRFHGQLSIVDRGSPTSRCQQSPLQCLTLLGHLGGFGILAHVDIQSGFEIAVPGASPHKADVLCHPALLGIELKHAGSPISYGSGDPDHNRAAIGNNRIERLNLGSKQFLARVVNSDAHTLKTLGRNAEDLHRVTRYKMDNPSFNGIRIALEDADARVRIEDQIPQMVPRVLGVHIEGGFLNGQTIQFNPNLNCIIGGRGTGKSTTFEIVRCLAGGSSDSKVVDCEIWPDELHLFWQDSSGQQHTLHRRKDGQLENSDDEALGPCVFDMDCFGQGDAARISQQAHSNPLALLAYLDRFIDLKDALTAEDETRAQLLALQSETEKAEQQVEMIPQVERLLATTKQQLQALKKPNVKELVELQRRVALERELRTQITAKVQEAKRDLGRVSPTSTADQIHTLGKTSDLSLGADEFRRILTAATVFANVARTAETQTKAALQIFEQVMSTEVTNWKAKDSDAQRRIEDKRRELQALNVSFDLSHIAKLAADEAKREQDLKNLATWKQRLTELQKQRVGLLQKRWQTRSRVAGLRSAFGSKASATLAEALADLQVSLKYARSAYSPEAEEQIIQAMGWRTNQQVRANYLIETLTVPALLQAIQRNDPSALMALRTPENVTVFEKDEAAEIIKRLGTPSIRFMLERAMVYDIPRLQVTRTVPDGSGSKRYVTRLFSKLSLGQQQSILLALMLSSDTDRPLIIDQPEDNLDGEFIYSTLVPVLRRAKERRQIIIVTHNANVAVLSDSELLVVMKAFNDRGEVVSRGSIDHQPTRDAAFGILEGAREAFLRRAKMYGVQISSSYSNPPNSQANAAKMETGMIRTAGDSS